MQLDEIRERERQHAENRRRAQQEALANLPSGGNIQCSEAQGSWIAECSIVDQASNQCPGSRFGCNDIVNGNVYTPGYDYAETESSTLSD